MSCPPGPGSVQGPEDDSGNTEPDYHPGNGKGNGNGKEKGPKGGTTTESTAPIEEESTETVTLDLSTVLTEETEPTEDITTELVKENPIRYAGYYWDRKTQYYYLQARYYDPRPARFISEDTYEGEIENPQSLNQYVYVENNPLIYMDPTGFATGYINDDGHFARDDSENEKYKNLALAYAKQYLDRIAGVSLTKREKEDISSALYLFACLDKVPCKAEPIIFPEDQDFALHLAQTRIYYSNLFEEGFKREEGFNDLKARGDWILNYYVQALDMKGRNGSECLCI
ncbi:hypothetical protein SD71_01775 [Cohnella kolymensis]|uniref:RHS repeat-associated core domain-containing protein n=1 Tax=Cohnella kolymensis TaxID=1590652 RepID=A0ABR5A9P7_9BACL|nr:RHS repeat-associated core domain-containing protein [Cohnella kolymensis]KIL37413.1 hypothetical protein SD71_01775 [Cohnella kolymensis]